MSKLILNPEYKLYERNGQSLCSSRQLAEEVKREHFHILRTIDNLTASTSGLSEEFRLLNFQESIYKDASGKWNREVLMTKNGLMVTIMELKTAKARAMKEEFIKRFDLMESFIKSLLAAKMEHPAFTDAIMNAHEEPRHYHFSNESDMINRIVLGMSAKQFKESIGMQKASSIRPYLNAEQIRAIETLQRVDIGLIVAIPDYEQRKQTLAQYYERMKLKRIA